MLLLHLFKLPHNDTERNQVPTLPEMGIYRDNLSAIIFYRLLLLLKTVLIYRSPISLL